MVEKGLFFQRRIARVVNVSNKSNHILNIFFVNITCSSLSCMAQLPAPLHHRQQSERVAAFLGDSSGPRERSEERAEENQKAGPPVPPPWAGMP